MSWGAPTMSRRRSRNSRNSGLFLTSMKTARNGVVTAPVMAALCHSKREQSAFPDIGGRGVEHGKIAGDAAHRQMRGKGHRSMLLGKPIDQLLQPLLLAAFGQQPD